MLSYRVSLGCAKLFATCVVDDTLQELQIYSLIDGHQAGLRLYFEYYHR